MAQFLGMDFGENTGPLLQGLLAGAGAALASRGNRAQAIGSGLLGAVGGYSGGQQNALMSDYRNQQMAASQQALQQKQRRDAYLQSAYSPAGAMANGAGPTVANAQQAAQNAGPTWAGLLQAGFGPDEAQKILSRGGPKLKDFEVGDVTGDSLSRYLASNNPADLVAARKMEIANNGQAYNPYDVRPGTVFNDPNAAFMINAQGQIVANTPAQQFALQKARAGASQTNVRVENKTGESLAGQIGPMMRDSQAAADAAVRQIQAADSIDAALNSGNVITGPGANARLSLTQLANTLNMGDGDDEQKLANTRQALQGLAQLTLQGRQQMRGQGAITENESRLAERAVSGDLSMTPAELRVLTAAAKRAGTYVRAEHARKVQAISSNPDFAPLVPFYTVPDLPQAGPGPTAAQPAPGGAPNIEDLLSKYR